MKIISTIDGSIATLEIEGSLSSEMKHDFEEELALYLQKSLHVVLDLSRVTFIDSSTLGSIVKYYTTYRKKNMHLIVGRINAQILDVFRLTGIAERMKIFETPQQAADFIRSI